MSGIPNFAGLNKTNVDARIAAYAAPISHTHDDRYYTETEIDSLISGYYASSQVDTLLSSKSDVGHTHDDRYYTETEIDNGWYTSSETDFAISAYAAPAVHTHAASDVVSGTFDTARIPSLDASKITTGTFTSSLIPWATPGTIGSTTPSTGAFTYMSVKQDLGNPAGADIVKPLMVVQQDVSQIPGLQFGYLVRAAGVSYGGSIMTTLNSSSGGWGARLALGVPGFPFTLLIDDSAGNLVVGATSILANAPERLNVNGNIGINGSSTFPLAANTIGAWIRGAAGLFAAGNGDIVIGARQTTGKGVAMATGDSSPLVRFAITSAGKIAVGTDRTTTQFSPTVYHETRFADAATNSIVDYMRWVLDSSGTPADNFGFRFTKAINTGTSTNRRDAASDIIYAKTISDGSRAFGHKQNVFYTTTEQQYLHAIADSGGVQLAVYDATPLARQSHIADPSGGTTVDTEARAAIVSLLAAIENFGILKTS